MSFFNELQVNTIVYESYFVLKWLIVLLVLREKNRCAPIQKQKAGKKIEPFIGVKINIVYSNRI